MCDVPDSVITLLETIAKSESFSDYKLDFKPGCKNGDGFLSNLVSVTISGTRKLIDNDCVDELYLVCKIMPSCPVRQKEFESIIFFKREICMYSKILPILNEFEQASGLTENKQFRFYPKCYAFISNDETEEYALILEDIRPKGFSMYQKNKILTVEYAHRIVEQLAKLHAISFAIRDQRPDICEEFKKLEDVICTFLKTDTLIKLNEATYKRCIDVLENPRHVEIVKELRDTNQASFEEVLRPGMNQPFNVISHGDFWINNMLFRCKNGVS